MAASNTPDPLHGLIDFDAYTSPVNVLGDAARDADKRIELLERRVAELELQTGAAAVREIALRLALASVAAQLETSETEGTWKGWAAQVLRLIGSRIGEKTPAAEKVILDAAEHQSCEEKIRELASAIFPGAKDPQPR